MASKIVFDKEVRALAKKNKKALFAIGYETEVGSRMQVFGFGMTGRQCDLLGAFCIKVMHGESPEAAFKKYFNGEKGKSFGKAKD